MVSRTRPSDDPQLHDSVRALLRAASAPAGPGPLPGEDEALAAFVAAQQPTRRTSMRTSLSTRRVALVSALGAGALFVGGVGAAAAGVLPGAAQDSVSGLLSTIGVEVPGADEHSAGHADQRGSSGDAPVQPEPVAGESGEGTSGKGGTVSGMARDENTTGLEKGTAVSGYASGGNSQAGQHGAPDTTGSSADHGPAVETPNDGGTGTATDANEEHAAGASSAGAGAADEASSGHSAAGSKNRP